MSRWEAASIHLAISVFTALCTAALLYLLWFPPPYFVAAGASTLMLLIMGVDVVMGPLLTLVAFSATKSKRMLRIDLTIIGLLQVAAFAYGLSVICQARPIYVVAAVDRLVVVSANELSDADLEKGKTPEFRRRSWTGPKLVGAQPNAADAPSVVMQASSGGNDIDHLPKYYVAYDQVSQSLLRHAHPLSKLKGIEAAQQADLQQLTDKAKERGDSLVYVPLQTRKADFAAILSTQTHRPVAVVSANPW